MAVAAAALLCIGAGFVFRSCGGRAAESQPNIIVVDNDSVTSSVSTAVAKDSIKNGKRGRRAKRRNSSSGKTVAYPLRSPLDEPCD